MRHYLIIFLIGALFASAIPCALAQEIVERSEDDLVLVTLRFKRTVINDAVTGYANKGSVMLPLAQISEALQFNIRVRPKDGTAEGWFLNQENHFQLDARKHEITFGNTHESYTPGLVEMHKDDIYVDTALLNRWFPLDFQFSFAAQQVTILPHEGVKLAVEREAERERMHSSMEGRTQSTANIPLPQVEAPYQLYSLPFADITYTSSVDSRDDRNWANDVSVLANGDLLYMHSSIFFAGNEQNKIDDLRWTLSRRDPEGKLFREKSLGDNPIAQAFNDAQVREFAVGDVYTQQVPLTAFNQQGRGVLISTKPYDRATQYDRTTLQGDLPPGWEVELYRNDELLEFRRASDSGRYEFIDVPLLSGLNIVRLVFYGPFGQTREEVQRFLVSPNIAEAGKGYFQISVTQQDTSMFNLNNRHSVSASGVTFTDREAARGNPRLLAEYEYGLAQNISLFGSFVRLTAGDALGHSYVTGGAAAVLAGIYGRVDVSQDVEQKGHALEVNLQHNLFGVSLSAQHQQFMDFISEFTENVLDPVTMRTLVRADTPINFPLLPHMNTGLSALRQVYHSGRTRYEIEARTSTAIDRVAISHSLIQRRDETTTSTLDQTRGEFIVSFPVNNWLLRANTGYTISPGWDIDMVAATSEYHFDRDTLARLEVSRQMTTENLTTYTAAVNHRFDGFMLGANASHSDDGNNAVGLTLSLSIGEEPRNNTRKMYADYSARDGFVSARAFHDKNNNGVYDSEDAPVEHARFRINEGGGNDDVTDTNGIVMLRNIPPDTVSRVTIEPTSLDNPYLVSNAPGAQVIARPGVPVLVDVPLVATSDVEGMVYINEGTKIPAANVQLQAVGLDGKIVREVKSAYDGFYLMETLPVGSYTLRIAPDQESRLGLHGKEISVAIDGSKESLTRDIIVKR